MFRRCRRNTWPSPPLGRARLKSSNIGLASAVTSTLEGLMSWCNTPQSWAYWSASARRAPHHAIAWANDRPRSASRPSARGLARTDAPSSSSTASKSAPVFAERVVRLGKQVSQRDSAEKGHAEQMKARDDVDVIRVDRDNVRVL